MAEINTSTFTQKTKGVKRCKKLSTKVDLTPMVDLGFLLITFFIFTTSLNEPMALNQVLPADNDTNTPPSPIAESKTLQLVLKENNSIAFFNGDNSANAQTTNYSVEGLRRIILEKREMVAQKFGEAKDLVVLIKPTTNSTYKNFIDVVDELKINGVTRYMLTDLSPKEKNIFEN